MSKPTRWIRNFAAAIGLLLPACTGTEPQSATPGITSPNPNPNPIPISHPNPNPNPNPNPLNNARKEDDRDRSTPLPRTGALRLPGLLLPE